jgi:hypothetical protein
VKRVVLGNVVRVKYGSEAIVENAKGVPVEEVVDCVTVTVEVVECVAEITEVVDPVKAVVGVLLMVGGARVGRTLGGPVGGPNGIDGLSVPGPTGRVPVDECDPGPSSPSSSSSVKIIISIYTISICRIALHSSQPLHTIIAVTRLHT